MESVIKHCPRKTYIIVQNHSRERRACFCEHILGPERILERLIVSRLVKRLSAFHRFMEHYSVFTRGRHWPPSWANLTVSRLRLRLPRGPDKNLVIWPPWLTVILLMKSVICEAAVLSCSFFEMQRRNTTTLLWSSRNLLTKWRTNRVWFGGWNRTADGRRPVDLTRSLRSVRMLCHSTSCLGTAWHFVQQRDESAEIIIETHKIWLFIYKLQPMASQGIKNRLCIQVTKPPACICVKQRSEGCLRARCHSGSAWIQALQISYRTLHHSWPLS
jgi:hypothetical protein